MLLKCGVGKDSWESLGLQGDTTSQSYRKSVLKYSLEGVMLKLKLQYFGHLMRRTDSLEKALMLGKIEERRRRGWQRMRWLDGITDSMDMSFEQALGVGDGQESLACCSPWGRKELDMIDWLNWTHASKVMFKILHACLQHYANQEIPDVQAGIRKGRGTRGQIANIHCIIEKARELKKKKIPLFLWLYQSLWWCQL